MNDLGLNRGQIAERHGALFDNARQENGAERGAKPFILLGLHIAKRWKWLILGAIAVSIALGLIVTLLMTPLYTASATLEIQRESYRIVQVEGVEPEASGVDMEFYQTQYGLLRARTLAERVAEDLRLHDDVNFFDMFGANDEAAVLRGDPAAAAAPAARRQRLNRAGEILLENVGIAPVRLSRLVDVSFTSPDTALSARIANAWTRHFIELNLARRFEATSYARRFLEERLDQLRQRLEESERTLVAYASQQGIINIPSASAPTDGRSSSANERPLLAEDLSTLNRELNQATADRVAAQSRLRSSGGATAEALQNQGIAQMRSRRAELASEHARLLTQFEPEYPPAVALANQIRELDSAITREEQRVSSTLQATYQSALQRESDLRSRVDRLRGDLLDLRGRTIQYNIYQREADTNRELYDGLLQRYKEIGVAGGVGVNNVSIVDAAQPPERPSSPRLILNLLIALLAGGMIGVGLALALEQIDDAISDPTDVEKALGLPLLGTVPKVDTEHPETELEDPKSPLVEAYLSMQTSLAFTTDHGIPRSLTVTSTRPAEGKTTTSYALARSLTRTGRKVLLIDADMRSPSLHHIFGVKNARGLSNYLAGDADLASMIHRDFPNGIALITGGPPPPNAAELLTSDRLRQMIQELTASFDHVILDVPPVMGLADTPLIASQVEGTIFVIQSHATRSSMARVTIDRLRDAQARVLGVVLTKFESKRAHYGYGYEYGYGYGERAKSQD